MGGKEEDIGKWVYNTEAILGQGGFGAVYRGTDKKTGLPVAIKVVNQIQLQKKNPKMYDNVLKEVDLQKKLKKTKSPHIVYIHGHLDDGDMLYVILELCDQGSLQDEIDKRIENEKTFTTDEILKYLCQIFMSLKPLQDLQIAHRDIKPDNYFVQNGILKLGDFGISTEQQGGKFETMGCGTAPFMAPEMIEDDGCRSHKVDLWAAGVIGFYLNYLTMPWDGPMHMIAPKIVNDPLVFPEGKHIDPILKDLIIK